MMPSPRFGAGFRSAHCDEVLSAPRAVDWFEVISDSFIAVGGPRRAMLARLRADYPIILHGLSLSIAGADPLSDDYLAGLRELADWIEPAWVSDHLCWTALAGHHSHDLLPIAYSRAVLDHVADRVARVQDVLRRRLVLENPSAYVAFRTDDMDEAEFFGALYRRTGCGMLLDVNNLYVNACNLGIDAQRYLATLPSGIVGYLHLAGHAVLPDVRIDTHDADVPPPVWELFEATVRRFPEAGVIVERDDNLPPFAQLCREVKWARTRHTAAIATPAESAPRTPPARAAAAGDGPAEPRRWRDLQDGFWARLVDKPRGFDHRTDDGLAALLDDQRPVRAARGMRVYSDAYRTSLRRALAVNFPALARVIRADDFDRLATAYLRRHPPHSYDFRGLGAHLSAFIRSYPLAADYGVAPAVLGELVALEQAQIEALDAPDEGCAMPPASLAAITPAQWSGASFSFARALRIVRATHDVLPVVEAVARGESPPRPAGASVAYLVRRSAGELHTDRMSWRDADLLERLVAGRTLAEACAAAGGADADEATLAAAAARVLIEACSRGLVVSARLPEADAA